jgi:hypothetical protein
VLWGVDFSESFEFFEFELFFAILLGLPFFLQFSGFYGFPSST